MPEIVTPTPFHHFIPTPTPTPFVSVSPTPPAPGDMPPANVRAMEMSVSGLWLYSAIVAAALVAAACKLMKERR